MKYNYTKEIDGRIKCPFILQVCGPSQSGKSQWVATLLHYAEYLLEHPSTKITWYSPHGHIPSLVKDKVTSKIGLPWQIEEDDDDEEEDNNEHSIIIIDDFADMTKNSKELTALFTKHSHHTNTSIIQIIQNLFWAGTDARTRSLNTHYFTLMRQLRDLRQIQSFAQQIAPKSTNQSSEILETYKQVIKDRQYSYLFISFHPRDDSDLMFRSHLFPHESASPTLYFYSDPPRKKYK